MNENEADENNGVPDQYFEERLIVPRAGGMYLCLSLTGLLLGGAICGAGIPVFAEAENFLMMAVCIAVGSILVIGSFIICCGLMTIGPNTAVLCTFCGKYVGTVKANGYFWVNPFTSKHYMSLQ